MVLASDELPHKPRAVRYGFRGEILPDQCEPGLRIMEPPLHRRPASHEPMKISRPVTESLGELRRIRTPDS